MRELDPDQNLDGLVRAAGVDGTVHLARLLIDVGFGHAGLIESPRAGLDSHVELRELARVRVEGSAQGSRSASV